MMESPLQRYGSQNKKNKRDVDRMSELADDIVGKIVSLLPLKEAAATSILSKRWRYIWTFFTTNLDFDGQEILNLMLNPLQHYGGKRLERERLNYIDRVNSVISQLNTDFVGIDRFRIDFDLCRSFSSSIDSWIVFALKNRVQILELDLLETGALRVSSSCYAIHKKIFKNPENDDYVSLKSLKVLNLTCVDIRGKVLEWLLSQCPLLERLQVIGSFKLISLKILGGPLKHLEIRECFFLKKFEICDAQNLVSLYFRSHDCFKFLITNVPKLVDLYIYLPSCLHRTMTALSSQLQILQLDVRLMSLLVYPMLTNLKVLKLIVNANENLNLLLSRIVPFLMVSPCLQRLELQRLKLKMELLHEVLVLKDKQLEGFIIEPTNCPLKEVEILGYSGSPNEDQLIIYFVENLVSLEKIIVLPSKSRIYPFKRPKDIKTIMKEEKVRNHAMQQLKEKIPTAVEFICL